MSSISTDFKRTMPKPLSSFPWIFSKKKKESLPPPTLPDDLLAEILSYLPPEITLKFKLVSKSWHQLISHPSLITSLKQRRLADRALGFFFFSTTSTVCFQPLPTTAAANNQSLISSINQQLQNFQDPILSSSDGLLLIGSSTKLIVWDPITKDSTSIRPPSWLECSYGLAATDSTSFHIVGVSQIAPVPCFNSSPFSIIYSSRTKRWTALFAPNNVNAHRYLNPSGPAFVGRSLYWLQHGSILAFNMKRRVNRLIALPRDDMVVKCGNVWLGRVGENLYLVHVSDEKNMEVWQLEKHGKVKRWKKVMEAKGDRWGVPEFFDGWRIAFSSPTGKGCEIKGCKKFEFYDTCCKEWQGSINYSCTDSADTNHCSLPYYL